MPSPLQGEWSQGIISRVFTPLDVYSKSGGGRFFQLSENICKNTVGGTKCSKNFVIHLYYVVYRWLSMCPPFAVEQALLSLVYMNIGGGNNLSWAIQPAIQ